MSDDPIEAAKKHIQHVKQTPERLIDAARASVDEAADLCLPANEPARGVEHDAKQHIARIERALGKERLTNEAMRAAVVTYGRRMTTLFRLVIALGCSAVLLGGLFTSQLADFARENCDRQNDSLRALRTIIERGDRNLAAFLKDGTITQAQFDRSKRAAEQAKRDLRDRSCTISVSEFLLP